jgi:hypothetical protein
MQGGDSQSMQGGYAPSPQDYAQTMQGAYGNEPQVYAQPMQGGEYGQGMQMATPPAYPSLNDAPPAYNADNAYGGAM